MISENWFFFGDSLTEGVGSSRISYLSEFVELFRKSEEKKPIETRRVVHLVKMRDVDPVTFNRYIKCNIAGNWSRGDFGQGGTVWIWNFACEGTTIKYDQQWLPWIQNIKPEKIFLFRGALENVIRPSAAVVGGWPWWVPASWHGYASMDPRCYFSDTWWRKTKQLFIDAIKQKIRLFFLSKGDNKSLLELPYFADEFRKNLSEFCYLCTDVYVFGMLPIADAKFPGSNARFDKVNSIIFKETNRHNATFLDWGVRLASRQDCFDLFYRDGFHPNKSGAKVLAEHLFRVLKIG